MKPFVLLVAFLGAGNAVRLRAPSVVPESIQGYVAMLDAQPLTVFPACLFCFARDPEHGHGSSGGVEEEVVPAVDMSAGVANRDSGYE